MILQNNYIFAKNVFESLKYIAITSTFETTFVIKNVACKMILNSYFLFTFSIKNNTHLLYFIENNFYYSLNSSKLFLINDAINKKIIPEDSAEFILIIGIESFQIIINFISVAASINLSLGQDKYSFMPPSCINNKIDYYIHIYKFKNKNLIVGKAYDKIYSLPATFLNNGYCYEMFCYGPFTKNGIVAMFAYVLGKKRYDSTKELYYNIQNPYKISESIDKLIKQWQQ